LSRAVTKTYVVFLVIFEFCIGIFVMLTLRLIIPHSRQWLYVEMPRFEVTFYW
jgi:hypothetical protein